MKSSKVSIVDVKSLNIDGMLSGWIAEDIGGGDITTNSIVPGDAAAKAYIHAKQAGVLAGLEIAARVFHLLDPEIRFAPLKKDGDALEAGSVIAEVEGRARAILSGERLALNLLQRLSAISTKTAKFAALVEPYPVRLVDTRKTTPGLRLLEKYAVTVGGGYNHRMGLYDAVLIKDNHIKIAGGVAKAVKMARAKVAHTVKIEVEVEDLCGVKEALGAGADIIMLDNMDNAMMREAVALVNKRAIVEASGGVSEATVAGVAATGVDFISVGALTHSVLAVDISMDIGAIK